MIRLFALSMLLLVSHGCHSRPVRVLTGGSLDFGGNMDVAMTGNLTTALRNDNTASPLMRVVVSGAAQCAHKIAVVDVDDLLVNRNLSGLGSMGENPVALFREKLRTLSSDPTLAAIVLRIDSPGGGVNASDLMSHELVQFKRHHPIPIVACILGVGAGGGYYIASHADHVIAQPTSIVGGIGVILNTYNLEDAMGQFNVVPVPVKSGDSIDMGSPQRAMEQQEREMLQGIADQMHQRFINQVQSARPRIPADAPVFDGRVVTGHQALEWGLVDQVGYMDDAIEVAEQMAQVSHNTAVVMLRRDNDRAFTVLDKTPNRPTTGGLIPLNIPGLDRSSLPTFLYLWQADPQYVTKSGG